MKNYGKIQTDKDVTTKQYVDNKNGLSQDDADARYLQLSGGTLNGDLSIDANHKIGLMYQPMFGNKSSYDISLVDNMMADANTGQTAMMKNILQINGKLIVNGETSFNGNVIHYIAAPTYEQDAANKKYVDDTIAPVSTKATSAETKATAVQNALANKQDKITGTANKLVGINASGVAAVTDTFTINGPITIGNVRIQYNSSTKSLDFVPIS